MLLTQIVLCFLIVVICALGYMIALARNQTILRVVWFLAMCGTTLYMAGKMAVVALTIICDLIEMLVRYLS